MSQVAAEERHERTPSARCLLLGAQSLATKVLGARDAVSAVPTADELESCATGPQQHSREMITRSTGAEPGERCAASLACRPAAAYARPRKAIRGVGCLPRGQEGAQSLLSPFKRTKMADQQQESASSPKAKVIRRGTCTLQLVDAHGDLRSGTHLLPITSGASGKGGAAEDAPDILITVFIPAHRDTSRPFGVIRWPALEGAGKHIDLSEHKESSTSNSDARSAGEARKGLRVMKGAKSSWATSQLHVLVERDSLSTVPTKDLAWLWEHRQLATGEFHALRMVLQAVSWTSAQQVAEMRTLLPTWAPPIEKCEALILLDMRVACPTARAYAVAVLSHLRDQELAEYLLQLTQALKHEPYHDSPLARLLVVRAMASPEAIGHPLFYHLQTESQVTPQYAERYQLLLTEYLRTCGNHLEVLKCQSGVLQSLTRVAELVKELSKADRDKALREMLSQLVLPEHFSLPFDMHVCYQGMKVEKCCVMSSKKAPLRLAMYLASAGNASKSPDDEVYNVILKVGDDLRQDAIAIQMLRLMEGIWRDDSLDLHLTPYKCVTMGQWVGLIEVVPGAETVASITRAAGGAMAAFREDHITAWLRSHNPTDQEYENAVHKFACSCAGYCVATYILGVGDRHNDNIMITRSGAMLHIDYGHFLGNIKRFFGVKRETAPFAHTPASHSGLPVRCPLQNPAFGYVLGGPKSFAFIRFVSLCCNAYNSLRRHANLFINLFSLMVSTGIPELQSLEDIEYMREALSPGLTDEQASEKFTNLIHEALDTKLIQVNDAIHILAH
ncbi:hypothetical protein CYMTET_17174 [Cymbomonas tetramitiformis]|uniref:Phosphatidylinositol 3-kinase n=1 Tax=Cymbomonas tetramitiformis TaxID=36881 RepID=A0AAE0L7E3_9CHLO|nr:hypothetical protein CYMTET_17174 [Cymbomonas tetramitiformis]